MLHQKFTKMHGAGNDFIIVEPQFFALENLRPREDTFSQEESKKIGMIANRLCQFHFAVGADGILVVSQITKGYYKMSVFNSDSSFAKMCGNGLRCVAAYIYAKKAVDSKFSIMTDSGDKEVTVNKKGQGIYWVSTNLGNPSNLQPYQLFNQKQSQLYSRYLIGSQIYSCNLGNDHLVVFISQEQFDAIEKYNAYLQLSKYLKNSHPFNVNFCVVKEKNRLKLVTCENGAGVTFACGTGSASTAFTSFKLGLLPEQIEIETRGGLLTAKMVKNAEGKQQVLLSGPAEYVFTGSMQSQLL